MVKETRLLNTMALSPEEESAAKSKCAVMVDPRLVAGALGVGAGAGVGVSAGFGVGVDVAVGRDGSVGSGRDPR